MAALCVAVAAWLLRRVLRGLMCVCCALAVHVAWRLCAWSVSTAKQYDHKFLTVASALLSGKAQTVGRSEVCAGLFAMQCAAWVVIYSDSKYFVDGVCSIIDGIENPNMEVSPDSDLWNMIRSIVRSRPAGSIRVYKIKSHRDILDAVDSKDAWEIAGNNHVDQAAGFLNLRGRNNALSRAWKKCRAQHDKNIKACKQAQQLIIDMDIARIAAEKETEAESTTPYASTTDDQEVQYFPQASIAVVPDICIYPLKYVACLQQWATRLLWPDMDNALPNRNHMSFHELMVDFCLFSKMRPPINIMRNQQGHKTIAGRAHVHAKYCTPDSTGTDREKLASVIRVGFIDEVLTFVSSIRLLARRYQFHIIPIHHSTQTHALRKYGLSRKVAGFACCPVLCDPSAVDLVLKTYFQTAADNCFRSIVI